MLVAVYISAFTFFFFNDTATTEIYTLSLHDALPICEFVEPRLAPRPNHYLGLATSSQPSEVLAQARRGRSEEHTSELQSQSNLVCRLLLEKKKINMRRIQETLPLPTTVLAPWPYTRL